MQSRMIAACLGIAWVSCWAELPPPYSMVAITLVCSIGWLASSYLFSSQAIRNMACIALCFCVGLVYSTLYGYKLQYQRLDQQHENELVTVLGTVIGLPKTSFRYGKSQQRFMLSVDRAPQHIHADKLLINWYGAPEEIIPGQQWQLSLRLRQPRGLKNSSGFDYQRWLIQQGIDAVATVMISDDNQQVDDNPFTLSRFRWYYAVKLSTLLTNISQQGLIKALLIADKRAVKNAKWQLFARTGVIHLLVISGLHIGIIAIVGFYFGRVLGLLFYSPWSIKFAAAGAVFLALAYSAAAGFSLPTQRACIMVCVFMLAIFLARRINISVSFWLAILLCLIIDPLAIIASSFWLSFLAVGAILLVCTGRRYQYSGSYQIHNRPWFRAQFAVLIVLSPVILSVYNQAPVWAALINIIAIPLFSLLVVPGLFISALLSFLLPTEISLYLWRFIDFLLNYFVKVVEFIDSVTTPYYLPDMSNFTWSMGAVAIMLLLLPRAIPGKLLAMIFLLPLITYQNKTIGSTEYKLTVLDVGQGLSLLVETQHHVLLFDTGGSWPDGSMGQTVVIPYLKSRGYEHLDKLVISHGDNDHAGGFEDIAREISIKSLMVGETIAAKQPSTLCKRQKWRWDEVSFEFLSVPKADLGSANNRSCVLLISNYHSRVLLTGDIERSTEADLWQHYQHRLRADVVVAPHHGSLSSSSWPFIKAVGPQWVIYSTGYYNRFNHPHPRVVERYQALGALSYNTAQHGAISVISQTDQPLSLTYQRLAKSYYWQ